MAVDFEKLVLGPAIDVFGDPVIYTPEGGTPFTITGVLDQAYLEQVPIDRATVDRMGRSVHVTGSCPALGVKLSQFPVQPKQNDGLTIAGGTLAGESFVVREVKSDGVGGATLMLNEAP